METSYRNLLVNTYTFKQKLNSPETRNLIEILSNNCEQIEQTLSKFHFKRPKRALISILGSAIKFITGNLDENDLVEINTNFNVLFSNEEKVLKQINKFTTFANHISVKYDENMKIIQENINTSLAAIYNIDNKLKLNNELNYNIYLSQNLLYTLKMIERTVSLAFKGITNLELITLDELQEIFKHLTLVHSSEALPKLDKSHPFKILEFSKFKMISIDNNIVCILYIPILQRKVYQYAKIYPVPTHQMQVLVPPSKYHLYGSQFDLWTSEECQPMESEFVCLTATEQQTCSLKTLNNCTFATVRNDYCVQQRLKNEAILVATRNPLEVFEECGPTIQKFIVKNVAILSSNCTIIIADRTFVNTHHVFDVKSPIIRNYTAQSRYVMQLQQKHLENTNDIVADLKEINEEVHLRPVVHITHFTLTFIIFVCLLSVIVYLISYFRKRILNSENKNCNKNEDVLA
jgi:hypothetical protein